ncbi:hypothetical protein [Ideonella sp.]|uniref:hypothetical protein n=1 Tax=Ideonella sp. TaxID=1929293 RepID=UPI0035ADDFB0
MDPRSATPDCAAPLFDVYVRLPGGLAVEEAGRRMVARSGLTPEQARRIVTTLRQAPVVQVRRSVDEARARKTEHQLAQAGLQVEVQPVQPLRPAAAPAPGPAAPPRDPADDTRGWAPTAAPEEEAPEAPEAPEVPDTPDVPVAERRVAGARVIALPDDDPSTLSFDLHGDAADLPGPGAPRPAVPATGTDRPDTRAPARDLPPAAAPARPRRRGGLAAVALVGVAGLAFVLGRMSSPALPAPGHGESVQMIDRVLATVDAPAALAEASAVAGAASAPAAADDLREGESLLRLAEAERSQGRVLPLAQAVAQAQGAAPAAPGATPALLGGAARPAGPAAPPEGAPAATPPPLPAAVQASLTAALAEQLAEFGQAARAREVLAALRQHAARSGDPAVAALSQRAEVLLAAWALGEQRGATLDRGVVLLRQSLQAVESPAARAALVGRVATVLAQHEGMPDSLALALLADAGEALKGVADRTQRQAAIDDWLVHTGDLLVAQLARHARLGRWPAARSLGGQLDSLSSQARSPRAVLQLQGLRARASVLLGERARGERLLADALRAWGQHGGAARQADELREFAARVGPLGTTELHQATAQLATAADALRGTERAQALTSLALMQAEAGEPERFEAVRSMWRQSPDAARPEAAPLLARLLVEAELAAARAEQRAGAYGEAEARLRRAAAYLL